MKKYLLLLSALVLFVTPTIANAGTAAVGFTIASNSIDTVGKEDVDNNGSIDDTKNVSDDIYTGSIFAEYTEIEGNLAITYGVDYIPFDADIDRRSISQSSLGDKASGAASTGTNSVSASVSDHLTLYLQPGYMMTPDSMLFATFGIVRADLDGKSTSLTHTDISSSKSLDGPAPTISVKLQIPIPISSPLDLFINCSLRRSS